MLAVLTKRRRVQSDVLEGNDQKVPSQTRVLMTANWPLSSMPSSWNMVVM